MIASSTLWFATVTMPFAYCSTLLNLNGHQMQSPTAIARIQRPFPKYRQARHSSGRTSKVSLQQEASLHSHNRSTTGSALRIINSTWTSRQCGPNSTYARSDVLRPPRSCSSSTSESHRDQLHDRMLTCTPSFFVQLNTHSPIMEDYYRDPRTHSTLLTEEPLLCCTILCIATRYAVLPGPGAHTRGYQLHSLLFRHVQAMIQRTVWGVEERSVNRTLGSIESLLLLTEWVGQCWGRSTVQMSLTASRSIREHSTSLMSGT